eukprot:CAMPEP_0197178686 /NCGR_PEP_ID=MMETSP1423-20130617/3898_1 /TAXON_ID=476441 /ORGANISM="Pseudo-nitzschia heimii, Strain UNC1101" /LENGTH=110 /DNA_ID=CAMNT_0042628483 /DNA_START=14 /DNA_END=343 /DNA_ORIENTATION=-
MDDKIVSKTTKGNKKRVSFGSLEIHEHAVELGGQGVPSSGPPMTLSWKEQSCFKINSVEAFENSRNFCNRKGSELMMTKTQRIDLLVDEGYTFAEIQKCMRDDHEIRKQR